MCIPSQLKIPSAENGYVQPLGHNHSCSSSLDLFVIGNINPTVRGEGSYKRSSQVLVERYNSLRLE